MKTKISIFIILWMGVLLESKAQTPVLSNVRSQTIKVSGDSILVDSLSMIPESLSIDQVDAGSYSVNYLRSMLIWKQKPLLDSITITYRVFSINFYQKYFHKDVKKIETNFAITPPITTMPLRQAIIRPLSTLAMWIMQGVLVGPCHLAIVRMWF